MPKLNPYLNFAGNAEEAFDFYKAIFGGEYSSIVKFKDMPMEGVPLSEADGEKVMHIALPIGDDLLMASDALESFGQKFVPGTNNYISVHPDTREEADRIFSALSEGADIEMPIADQMWGDYYGSLKDKFGIGWMVNYSPHKEG
ncbi:MAG TPA: VOC family protein [Actinomycetota bacterium]|nr:VOC family protein [Actinomycetota bacterium]